MNSVRIKVCGITRTADAELADELAVDAIGFVFVQKSKRFVSVEQAAEISAAVGPFMQRVGLFLDDEPALVEQALSRLPALLLQFHGRESASYCEQFNRPYIKAIGVAGGMPSEQELNTYENCAGFLFDSNAPGSLGGTGHTFDWAHLQGEKQNKNSADNLSRSRRLILAGGLNPDNIGSAVQQVKPYAVDVSTGVEVSPGIKDAKLMRDFVSNARNVTKAVTKAATASATPKVAPDAP